MREVAERPEKPCVYVRITSWLGTSTWPGLPLDFPWPGFHQLSPVPSQTSPTIGRRASTLLCSC